MMKRILTALLAIVSFIGAGATETSGKIAYFPVVNGKDMPAEAQKLLTTKMEQIAAKYGYGSANHTDRFLFVAKGNVLEKDVTPTTPPRIRQEVEVTFLLGDVIENKVYASTSLTLKGIGINETKAWQTAINSLNVDNAAFPKLFEEATGKIESYYQENCTDIMAKARALASTGKFDEAIASLLSIPEICTECYNNALNEAGKLYQEKIDNEGAALIIKARNAWSMTMDQKGADQALSLMSEIDPQSAAFSETETLSKEISSKLSSDKAREWEHKMKKYNDEMALRRREQRNAHAQSMATIAAARSIAEKWAENQPENKVYINW